MLACLKHRVHMHRAAYYIHATTTTYLAQISNNYNIGFNYIFDVIFLCIPIGQLSVR